MILAGVWLSRKNRSDALAVLIDQGRAFTESMAIAAQSAALGQQSVERLLRERFHAVALDIASQPVHLLGDALPRVAERHLLDLILVVPFADHRPRIGYPEVAGSQLPIQIEAAVRDLKETMDSNAVLLFASDSGGAGTWYYVELSNRLDQVIVLSTSAASDRTRIDQSGLGRLLRTLGEQSDIRLLVYQSPDGIIASSQSIDSLISIASDTFLLHALDADQISHRVVRSEESSVLELVRPFQAAGYPFGLLRVHLSLTRHEEIAGGFDRQVFFSVAALCALLLTGLISIENRRRRQITGKQFERYRLVTEDLFARLSTGIAVLDERRIVRQANAALQQWAGKGITSDQPWQAAGILSDEELTRLVMQPSGVLQVERSVHLPEQSLRLLVSASTVRIDDEAMLVIIVSDMTALRLAEEQAGMKARLAELGNIAAGVAHEIRNPLNTISIASQRLASEFTPTSDVESYHSIATQIRTETARVNETVTRFLKQARSPAASPVGSTCCDLLAVLRDLKVLWELELTTRNAVIEIVAGISGAAFIPVSPDDCRALLMNLYVNARDALRTERGTIRVTVEQHEGQISLLVDDSGRGFNPEDSARIFEPYYTTKTGGTGLGLSLVREIVQGSGGKIAAAQSPVLGGAQIRIDWPNAVTAR